jgi:hypothetical protein
MDKIDILIIVFIALIVVGNIYTSYRLLKTDQYDNTQKTIQFFIIWFIPTFGAMFVSHFLDKNNSDDSGSYNGGCEVGGDVGGGEF